MSKAAKSILVFGLYLGVLGSVLVLVPNLLLELIAIPPTQEAWIRVAGVLALILAFYYVQAARSNVVTFFAGPSQLAPS